MATACLGAFPEQRLGLIEEQDGCAALAGRYRSVKLVVQNNTNENLTVQGHAVLTGSWADKMAPQQGMLVSEQSAGEWTSISTELGTGTGAYVRFGCSRGYPMIRWTLPWSGPFEYFLTQVAGIQIDVLADGTHSDAIVLLATMTESRGE